MSSSYEERLSMSIGAVKDIIRKIRTILEGVAKHTNIHFPKNIKDLIFKRFINLWYVSIENLVQNAYKLSFQSPCHFKLLHQITLLVFPKNLAQ